MTDWSVAALLDLTAALEEAADEAKAQKMAAYMKDRFAFYGVASPEMKVIHRGILNEHGKPDRHDVLAFVADCWAEPEREFHYTGQKMMRRYVRLLEAEDLAFVRWLLETNSWWDSVDELAGHVVGGLVSASPELVTEMDRWVRDENMWVARAAILHQLFFKEDTDTGRLFSYCEQQMGHKDFFIRKAIGWALRQYGRVDGDAVRAFVAKHEAELSGLSKREALKHL